MATFDYASSQATAKRLIARFGTTATLKRISKVSSDDARPWKTSSGGSSETIADIPIVFLRYSKRQIDGVEIKTGDVRAIVTNDELKSKNTAPDIDTTRWSAYTIPDWSARSLYPADSYVSYRNNNYHTNTAIAAPQDTSEEVTSYVAQATYNVGSSGNTAGAADYFNGVQDEGISGLGVFCNILTASGEFPSDTSGTWRLRLEGGAHDGASITGTIQNYRPVGGNRLAFRIGTVAEMRAVFGTQDFNSGGGVWHLERETTETVVTPGANPNPVDDDTWQQQSPPAWSALTAYSTDNKVSHSNSHYQSNTAIPAPHSLSVPYPLVNDIIKRNNGDRRDYRVESVAEFRPADDNVFYELQLRATE